MRKFKIASQSRPQEKVEIESVGARGAKQIARDRHKPLCRQTICEGSIVLFAPQPFAHVKSNMRPAGLEPATLGLEIPCSIHLSYGREGLFYSLF